MVSILTLLHSERPKLHRKAKIVCNFGLPECSRANYKGLNLRRAKLFALRVDSPVIDRQKCVGVYSNSRNDVPRVARRYRTIAALTLHRASVLIVFVVFCVHMDSFAGLIRLIPLFSSSELTGCGYPGLLDQKNCSDMCPRWESNPRLPACKASTLSTRPVRQNCRIVF